jgi:hypothetical protein
LVREVDGEPEVLEAHLRAPKPNAEANECDNCHPDPANIEGSLWLRWPFIAESVEAVIGWCRFVATEAREVTHAYIVGCEP